MKQTTRFPGFELKARRDQLGFSVEEIYRKLRIPAQTIHLLESGDLQKLPAACYTVGFLRSYCEFLGLPSKQYIDLYHVALLPPSRFRRPFEGGSGGTAQLPLPSWVRDGLTWAAVLGMVGIGWLTWSVVFQPNLDPAETSVQAGVLSVPTPPSESE
ncbi:MAG: hypothetical protein AMXMBFR84_00670 [Candidatus Hydrogenedentota bacterium]